MALDLTTPYLGLRLDHPFIAGASPLSTSVDNARRLEDAGCAGIVMQSLFEEQITMAESGTIRHRDPLDAKFTAMIEQFQSPADYVFGPDEYLEHIQQLKAAVRIPVIGSLNGTSKEAWLKYARLIESAGADAIELNMYEVQTDLDMPGLAVESTVRDVVAELKRFMAIPIAVKLSPFYSAFGNVARRLDEVPVDGLVLFNRFYQPDIDIRTMTAEPNLELSHSGELLLRLRWLAILSGRVRASLAATGGVETPRDGIKAILAGAHVVQLVSAILRHGVSYFGTVREALAQWMEWQHIESVDAIRGRVSLRNVADPNAFERANYIRVLHSWGR